MKQVKVSRLTEDAILPTRKHPTDAGMDLYANEVKRLEFGSFAIVKTGVTIEIPKGYVGLIWPKSRNNHLIGGGVVDSGYQGEIMVKVMNTSEGFMIINKGDPIAQLLIQKIETPEVIEASTHQVKTARGRTGGIVTQVMTEEAVASVALDHDDTMGTRS